MTDNDRLNAVFRVVARNLLGSVGGNTAITLVNSIEELREVNREIAAREVQKKPLRMPGADLSGTDLPNLNLIDANLRDANLSKTNLSNSDFLNADLTGTDLRGADLRGAINLTNDQLLKARVDDETKLPDHLRIAHEPAE